MNGYFGLLAEFAGRQGLEVEVFLKGLKAGTKAMAASSEDVINADAFWNEAYRFIDRDAQDWPAVFERFYLSDFKRIGEGVTPDANAARAVRMLKEKGYTLALTTMPMFPAVATAERLRWAGIDAGLFERITTYENSRSVKPRQTYYAENIAALGVRGEDVLMVGNNTVEDLAILDLGADAYVVTDNLIDPLGYDFSTVKHGSMADFAAWVETLPPCANSAAGVEAGLVGVADIERALAQNALGEIDREEAIRKAVNVTEDPTYERAKGGTPKVPVLAGEEAAE